MNIELMKNRRKELNLTQQQLADMCALSRVSISNYESGKAEPTMENLEKLSKVLDIDITDLIEIKDYTKYSDYKSVRKTIKRHLSMKIFNFLENDTMLKKFFFNSAEIYQLLTLIELLHESYFGWSEYFKKVIVYNEQKKETYFVDINKFIYAISSIILMIKRLDLIIFDENEKQIKANFEKILKIEDNYIFENKDIIKEKYNYPGKNDININTLHRLLDGISEVQKKQEEQTNENVKNIFEKSKKVKNSVDKILKKDSDNNE